MCTNPDRPWPAWDGSFAYDYDSLIKRIEKDRKKILQANSLYLTGGEPTLHPRFLDIVQYLKDNFPEQRIKLLTNGRRFAYNDFAKKFLAISDNLETDVSFCGANNQTHDAVTQARGSFEQTLNGFENLLKYKRVGQIVGVRTVLNRLTYQGIYKTLSLIQKKFAEADRVIVIFHELEAQAIKNIDQIKINYQEVAPFISQTASLLEGFKEIRFYHFPLCIIDQAFWPFVWKTLPDKEVEFLPSCHGCQLKEHCVGIHKGYSKHVGKKGFAAIKKIDKKKIVLSGNSYQPILKIIK